MGFCPKPSECKDNMSTGVVSKGLILMVNACYLLDLTIVLVMTIPYTTILVTFMFCSAN